MQKFVALLREGSWLTRSRLRAFPIIVLAAFAAALFWFVFGAGAQPWSGADFVGFWVPANLAAEGRSAVIYDPALLQQLQESVSGIPGYLPWPYPPIYLLLILPLGLLPYWYAFVIWECAGIAVCWLAVRQVVGRDGILLAIAFPAVWIAIINGHAEPMLAGLLGAALLRLDDRPIIAGTLIGFCAVKPHLFLLVPVALVVSAQWRAVAAACITIAALAIVSLVGWGSDPWRAFVSEVAGLGSGIAAAEGAFQEVITKKLSAFAYGASINGSHLAIVLQTVVSSIAAMTVALVWQRHRDIETRAMTLSCGTLLATPYLFDYDLVLLGVPIALIARRGMRDGFRPWEKSMLAALWILPFIARIASTYHIPLTPILLALSLVSFARPAIRVQIARSHG